MRRWYDQRRASRPGLPAVSDEETVLAGSGFSRACAEGRLKGDMLPGFHRPMADGNVCPAQHVLPLARVSTATTGRSCGCGLCEWPCEMASTRWGTGAPVQVRFRRTA
jgi:hypothetical protein